MDFANGKFDELSIVLPWLGPVLVSRDVECLRKQMNLVWSFVQHDLDKHVEFFGAGGDADGGKDEGSRRSEPVSRGCRLTRTRTAVVMPV